MDGQLPLDKTHGTREYGHADAVSEKHVMAQAQDCLGDGEQQSVTETHNQDGRPSLAWSSCSKGYSTYPSYKITPGLGM